MMKVVGIPLLPRPWLLKRHDLVAKISTVVCFSACAASIPTQAPTVCVANSYSSSNWMLEKTATILLPGVTVQRNRLGDSVTAGFRRSVAV